MGGAEPRGRGGYSNYDHVFTELTADAEKIQLQPGGRIPLVQLEHTAVQIKAEMSKCVSTFYLNRLKTNTCIFALYLQYIYCWIKFTAPQQGFTHLV